MVYNLYDIIKTKVGKLAYLTNPVYFAVGNWKELCIDLGEKGQSKTYRSQRYPLVFLHVDYEENCNGRIFESEPKIYIVVQSDERYTTEQRQATTYKDIDAIFDLFLKELRKGDDLCRVLGKIEYTKKNLYSLYVGDETNKLPDHLDGVEIKLKLKYKLKSC